jgi:hypothetical protein
MRNYVEEGKKKAKLQKAVDKMQGLKTFCVTETRTGVTYYTVKATDADEAYSIVSDRKPGYDDDVDYPNDGLAEIEVEEVE